jgi:hypothetical protein
MKNVMKILIAAMLLVSVVAVLGCTGSSTPATTPTPVAIQAGDIVGTWGNKANKPADVYNSDGTFDLIWSDGRRINTTAHSGTWTYLGDGKYRFDYSLTGGYSVYVLDSTHNTLTPAPEQLAKDPSSAPSHRIGNAPTPTPVPTAVVIPSPSVTANADPIVGSWKKVDGSETLTLTFYADGSLISFYHGDRDVVNNVKWSKISDGHYLETFPEVPNLSNKFTLLDNDRLIRDDAPNEIYNRQ